MNKKINIGESINYGWNVMKKNFWFFFLILIFIYGISIIFNRLELATINNTPVSVLITIIAALFNVIMSIGTINIALLLYNKKKVKFSDLFSQYKLFLDFLIGSILYGIMVFIGLLLLIVPGIYLAMRFYFFQYLILDKKMNPIQALKTSSKLTQGIKWQLFLFTLVILLLNIAGAIALLIGLFATIPTTMMAGVYVYKNLLKQAKL